MNADTYCIYAHISTQLQYIKLHTKYHVSLPEKPMSKNEAYTCITSVYCI